MNSWNFTGNLGQDCRAGNVGGTAVVNFSVASSSGYGDKKVTTWVDCALWGNRATALQQYLTKGQKVAITGEHGTREHDGKTYTTCRVDNVTLIGDKQDNQQSGGFQNNQQGYQQPRSETGLSPQQFNNQNNQAPNPYAQQVAQNAQGMQGQVSQQFANANQNPAMNGGGVVDQDIPFTKHFDGVM